LRQKALAAQLEKAKIILTSDIKGGAFTGGLAKFLVKLVKVYYLNLNAKVSITTPSSELLHFLNFKYVL